jgi:hypothetical protein
VGGSSSNFGTPPSGLGGSLGDRCDIRFRTDLFSPVAIVASSLKVGDYLDIVLRTEGVVTSVAAVTQADQKVAGTLAGARQIGDLVACLQQGHRYEGKIVAISGSSITLQISKV